MSLTTRQLTKIFGKQRALDQVTFEVKPGEIIGLLGPNGAGKSTLMKILTCFIPATSGDASVCGFDVVEQSLEVRKKIGYLPENNPLYTDLYVREFLSFIAGTRKISGSISKRVNEMISITGLEAEQKKKIGALSKGYRQRVGLAQALIHDPEVLILDEPTSGLDPNQLLDIRGLISNIGKTKTVLMSTHIMQEVEAICNRVIIIHKGKIVADDSTGNLQQISAGSVVIKVEFGSPVQGSKLQSVGGVKTATPSYSSGFDRKEVANSPVSAESTQWIITSDSASDIRPAIFQFAVDQKLTVLSLQKEEAKLEEVFQELTKL